jgi:hemerythrin-like domain-containing protein
MARSSTTTPTEILRKEHELILQVAGHLGGMLAAEKEGDPLDYDTVERCVTFFRLFADACHHGKEEDLLFPGLEDEGMSKDSGPIAVMLLEHEAGRVYVRSMAAALGDARNGDDLAGDQLRDASHGFIALISAHIGKENNILFSMADGMITGSACETLCARYDEVCRRRFEGETKEDLERLAQEILRGPLPSVG